jgi:hypothetical protein
MIVTVVSVSIIFLSFSSYSVAQDKVLRTAYLTNYLQSAAKAIYFIDASTLQGVLSYCGDDQLSSGASLYYCKNGKLETDAYYLNCDGLKVFKGHITVADLLKKDLDYSDGTDPQNNLDDRYGTSKQLGRTALRCAMKEIIKPLTFSGYKYNTEVAQAGISSDTVVKPINETYASDFMFSPNYQSKKTADPNFAVTFDCFKVATVPGIQSDQLLVIRTPFKLLRLEPSGFKSDNYVFRTCLWPSNDILTPTAP